jgi:Calcineurin-like phosphoesterase
MNALTPVGPRPDHDVAYVTDVEGSWERLASFLHANPFVSLDVGGRIVVRHGATFVFGGDAIDRGPHGRKVLRALLEVKARQPEQVVLLAGNRDLNKMRLVRELAGHPRKRAPDEVARGPAPELLKWIFQFTMGAADAFEHRRTELAEEQRAHDDDSVVQSYLEDLAGDGDLARYYRASQLAFRAGHTLFVHGGVAAEALTVIPGETCAPLGSFDVDAWVDKLHAFYARQVSAFDARALEADGRPAWEDAILYQAPKKGLKSNPGSVVYGRLSDTLNNPVLPERDVIDALVRTGIWRVVIGHTPSGDVPSVVRTAVGTRAFEVVCADNSRSRVPSGSTVLVRDAHVQLSGRCVLDDTGVVDVNERLAIDDVRTPIGRRMADGHLVKARVTDRWLVFRYLPHFETQQRLEKDLGALEDAVPLGADDVAHTLPRS